MPFARLGDTAKEPHRRKGGRHDPGTTGTELYQARADPDALPRSWRATRQRATLGGGFLARAPGARRARAGVRRRAGSRDHGHRLRGRIGSRRMTLPEPARAEGPHEVPAGVHYVDETTEMSAEESREDLKRC